MKTLFIVLSQKVDDIYHQQLQEIIQPLILNGWTLHLLVRISLSEYRLIRNISSDYSLELPGDNLTPEEIIHHLQQQQALVLELCNTEREREIKSLIFCVKASKGKLPINLILKTLSDRSNDEVSALAEDRIHLLDENINSDNQPTNLKTLINTVNHITRSLNKNYKNASLRQKRLTIMRHILPYIDKTVEQFVLPFIVPEIMVSASVALVGNSKRLLRKRHGHVIDSHTNVFRFNYAVTKGFEKHVGGKSDIRVGNIQCLQGSEYAAHPKGLVKDYRMYRTLPEKRYIIFSGKGLLGTSKITQYAKKNKMNLKVKKIHNIHWNALYFKAIRDDLNLPQCTKRPQCGTGFVLLLAELGIQPDLYGFDTSTGDDNFGYYWSGKVKHSKRSKHHVITEEHILLKLLAARSHINIL